MYKAVEDKKFWIAICWMLVWLYRMIFTANPSNCLYYEGKIHEISENAFVIDILYTIPSDKNSEWRRVFPFKKSDFRSIIKYIKVGDSFQLYYTMTRSRNNRKINIYQMYVNDQEVVKYNWFKWHWVELLLFLLVFFICFILQGIVNRIDARHPVENKLRQYKKYVVHYKKDIKFPKWFSSEFAYCLEFVLFEFYRTRYLQLFIDRIDYGVYKFEINEITKDNASEIARDIYLERNYTDRKYEGNLYEEMDSSISKQ